MMFYPPMKCPVLKICVQEGSLTSKKSSNIIFVKSYNFTFIIIMMVGLLKKKTNKLYLHFQSILSRED